MPQEEDTIDDHDEVRARPLYIVHHVLGAEKPDHSSQGSGQKGNDVATWYGDEDTAVIPKIVSNVPKAGQSHSGADWFGRAH